MFIGIPCVVVLLVIFPATNILGGIFVLSCTFMSFIVVIARLVKGIHEDFFKKGKKDV